VGEIISNDITLNFERLGTFEKEAYFLIIKKEFGK
jgi:hypothetical protein